MEGTANCQVCKLFVKDDFLGSSPNRFTHRLFFSPPQASFSGFVS